MRSVAVVARGVVSALGSGDEALGALRAGEREVSAVARDDELVRAGLAKPFAARAPVRAVATDRATALLEAAFAACATDLDRALPEWRGLRVAAAIGTSSGGMRSFEHAIDAIEATEVPLSRDAAVAATYIGPFVQAARPVAFEPASLVLGACASSTLALGLARSWLLDDRCDIVLAGGFDAVSVFVAAGFESLRATCSEGGPRPFRAGRDGLALGEAAAILALTGERHASRAARVFGWISGFGASCDATHLTAPDAEGRGLTRAAAAAIDDAGAPGIDLVGAHGTATVQNDVAEATAIRAVLGARAEGVPVFSLKGSVGHTLGAAGALETLATLRALERGVAPATVGEGAPEGGLGVLDRAEPRVMHTALKLSSAFGGANGALVLSVAPTPTRGVGSAPPPRAFVSRAVVAAGRDPDPARLALLTGYAVDRIARADALVRLSLAATAALAEQVGGRDVLRGAGVVIGHGLATLETNACFWRRIRAAGASRAEPRRFPYTSPNAAAGECAVAFGLTGPAFAVGGGGHGGIEAIGVASDLVRSGVVDRAVVVAVDEVDDTTRRLWPGEDGGESGAVALLVSAAPVVPGAARLLGWTVRLEAATPAATLRPSAHRPLLPLADGHPEEISAPVLGGGIAKASFLWL